MLTKITTAAGDLNRMCTTIAAGREIYIVNDRVFINAAARTATLQRRGPSVAGRVWHNLANASVSVAHMTSFVNFISGNTFTVGQHRNVLANQDWQAFYNRAHRQLLYIGNNNLPMMTPAEPSVPCYDCGIVLREANIHIDHQRPVAGNNSEAVCKVFRALGLTVGAGTGPKAAHFHAAHSATVNGVAGIAGATRDQKYTLNAVGRIYLTIADWCGLLQGNNEFDMACINHVINLRPLCSTCNTANRNTPHYPV